MAGTVQFVVAAEVGKALQNLLKVTEAEAKVQKQTEKTAAAATKSSREQEAAYQRVGRAAERSAKSAATFRGGYEIRRGDLATSPMMRAIARGGSVTSSSAMVQQAIELAANRQFRADQLRAQRPIDRRREFQNAFIGPTAAHLAMLQTVGQIRAQKDAAQMAAGTGVFNAGNLALAAGNPFMYGGGKFMSRARGDVARGLMGSIPGVSQSELDSLRQKISPEQLEGMAANRAVSLRKSADFKAGAARLAGGGVAAAGFAAYKVAENQAQELDERNSQFVDFQEAMRALLALGDNLKHSNELETKVRNTSITSGRSTKEVAEAMFSLQSGAANLPVKTQDELFASSLRLTKLAGGDLSTNLTALIKLYQTYGKELQTVQKTEDTLFFTMDQAAITMPEIANLLPDLLPALEAMKYSTAEGSGALITMTQSLGKNDKTIVAFRNIVLSMADAQRQGVVSSKDLVGQLKELENLDPLVLKDLFGDAQLAGIMVLIKRLKDVEQNIKNVQNVSAGLVEGKAASRASTSGGAADVSNSLDQLIADQAIASGTSAAGQRDNQAWKAITAANMKIVPAGGGVWRGIKNVLDYGGYKVGWHDTPVRIGLDALLRQYQDKADPLAAGTLRLTHGDVYGLNIAEPNGLRAADARDATEFGRLRGLGYDLTPEDFVRIQSLRGIGAAAGADSMLQNYPNILPGSIVAKSRATQAAPPAPMSPSAAGPPAPTGNLGPPAQGSAGATLDAAASKLLSAGEINAKAAKALQDAADRRRNSNANY